MPSNMHYMRFAFWLLIYNYLQQLNEIISIEALWFRAEGRKVHAIKWDSRTNFLRGPSSKCTFIMQTQTLRHTLKNRAKEMWCDLRCLKFWGLGGKVRGTQPLHLLLRYGALGSRGTQGIVGGSDVISWLALWAAWRSYGALIKNSRKYIYMEWELQIHTREQSVEKKTNCLVPCRRVRKDAWTKDIRFKEQHISVQHHLNSKQWWVFW